MLNRAHTSDEHNIDIRSPEDTRNRKDGARQSASADSGKKILYIEDERALSVVMSNKLNRSGFTVSLAADGIEGLRKIENESPDLVLLDLILPNKDGWEVLKDMQKKGFIKKIPVIIMSNLGQSSDIVKSIKLGAVDYIIKSDLSINEVIKKINTQLEKRK